MRHLLRVATLAPMEYLTAGSVADLFSVHRDTVRRWAASGALPVAGKTDDGTLLFDPAQMNALAEQRQAAVDPAG